MTGPLFEIVLARLYTDAGFRERFLAAPLQVALGEGLSEEEARAMAGVDRVGLELAAHSFEKKRAGRGKRG